MLYFRIAGQTCIVWGAEIKKKKKERKKNEQRLRHLWDNIKNTSICVMGNPEEEEREKGEEKIFGKLMADNFSILVEINPKQT